MLQQTMHKSNALCLKTYEKHTLKDFNYYMILQRNQATSTPAQTSVLKALLKWRDYVARVEDESQPFVLPNHIMFAMASALPTSRSELRDCCRSQYGSIIAKYQDDLLALISAKLERAQQKKTQKKNTHVVFGEFKPSQNPEALKSSHTHLACKSAQSQVRLVEGSLPMF
jgi:exosome complex exonuclease RRP6